MKIYVIQLIQQGIYNTGIATKMSVIIKIITPAIMIMVFNFF